MADETGTCCIPAGLEIPRDHVPTSFLFELKFENDTM